MLSQAQCYRGCGPEPESLAQGWVLIPVQGPPCLFWTWDVQLPKL